MEDANAEPSDRDATLMPSQEMRVAASPANAEPSDRDATLTPSQEMPVATSPAAPAFCPTCGGATPGMPAPHVYAIGRMQARFASESVEKEFAQVASRSETAGKTDQQTFHTVLSDPENRYLARQMCWVLTVNGLECYLVHPRDSADFGRLVETIRPEPSPLDIDVVIGLRGPVAPPEACKGLMLPLVAMEQVYSFDRDALIEALPGSGKGSKKEKAASEEVLDRILDLTDNLGATDEHRATNYLAMRYPGVYAKAAEQFERDFSLSGVTAQPSLLSSTRRIVDVIFSFTNRTTDFTEKFVVSCDVTDTFPFLVTKLSPYYDH